MKLYERIENNNFDEIDRNRAIELIKGGNGHLVYNENYFKLQKENEELEEINNKLEAEKNETIRRYNFETIPIQKVKDKIEEIKKEKNKFGNCLVEFYENELADRDIKILQELLEEREEK